MIRLSVKPNSLINNFISISPNLNYKILNSLPSCVTKLESFKFGYRREGSHQMILNSTRGCRWTRSHTVKIARIKYLDQDSWNQAF